MNDTLVRLIYILYVKKINIIMLHLDGNKN